MNKKTEKKLILYGTLFYANFLIWNFAGAEFKDWKEDIAPGLAVVEEKIGLDGVFIPKMIYDSDLHTKTEIGGKSEEPEEIKDNAEKVQARSEVVPQVELEVNLPTPKVEDLIRKYFPDNSEEMIKLFTCESGLEPDKVGDLALTFEHEGEILGSSHGLAQIRTGGKDGKVWNRAKANGMTVKEFQNKLHEPEYNLEYAKKIFDSRGYSAWYNCAKRNNLIK